MAAETKKVFNKDSAISLGVVISMIAVAVWTTTSHQVMKNQIDNQKIEIMRLEERVAEVKLGLSAHEAKGIGSLRHPAGIVHEINLLRDEMDNKISDRWKKADDYLFMKDFAATNQLNMPPHRTLDEASKKP